MAESLDHIAAAERYGAIEAAYCEDRWDDVLTQGRHLLADLGTADDGMALALRQRVQLLMAHTHLHSLGDRDQAEDLYRQVLATAHGEPALRRSAEEGIQLCDQPGVLRSRTPVDLPATVPVPPPAEPSPSVTHPQPEPVAPTLRADPINPLIKDPQASGGVPGPAAATPWLETSSPSEAAVPIDVPTAAIGSGPLPLSGMASADSVPVDVVEEPELLEVHRADPERAEEIELVTLEQPTTTADPAPAMAPPAGAMFEQGVAELSDEPAATVPERTPEPLSPAEEYDEDEDEDFDLLESLLLVTLH